MKKYSVILADPPWAFRAWSNKGMGRSAEQHYSTMRLENIKALPVADLAAEDCVLFLWAEAWGFAYKTVAFTWVKENRKSPGLFWGLGYWTRANAEICLLATRGSPKRQSAAVHQVILSPVEQHSKKPDAVRERIVVLMGDVPRVELFARQETPGWDVWGNEVSSCLDVAERLSR